jgi:hypothetical protein
MMKIALIIVLSLALAFQGLSQNRIQVQLTSSQPNQLIASAGTDVSSPASNVLIGGSPTAEGGLEPYTYAWSPSFGLSSADVANPELTADSSLTYILLITDQRGCTSTDTLSLFLIPNKVTESGEATLRVYPNPAGGIVNVELLQQFENANLQLMMLDETGREVYTSRPEVISDAIQLDIRSMSSGLYTIILNDGTSICRQQLVIKR